MTYATKELTPATWIRTLIHCSSVSLTLGESRTKAVALRLYCLVFILGSVFARTAGAQSVADSISRIIEREYFDSLTAFRIAVQLRERGEVGRYDEPSARASAARAFTEYLFGLSRDKHLAVTVRPTDNLSDSVRRARGVGNANAGLQCIEILPGNVGYIRVTHFFRPSEASEAFAAAMTLVRNSADVIIDLRGNSGGSPDMVAEVASYFASVPGSPLFEIVDRSGNAEIYRTKSVRPRIAGRLVIMTSSTTFSAGEGFAYLMQQSKRATIVGETTAGAANPGRPYPLPNGLEITVPTGKVRSLVGGTNWEGTGVTPDLRTSANEALDAARRFLKEKAN